MTGSPLDKAPQEPSNKPVAAPAANARFVTGSTMGHIVSMTAAGATGLMALFLVDLVDMYFIALLGEAALAAAIGFAGTILFFSTSISIGFAISTGALVSQHIGRGDEVGARKIAVDNWVFGFVSTGAISALIWVFAADLMSALGAKGEALGYGTSYLRIIIPSMPILAVAMMAGATLRGIGNARWPMYSTLAGGAVNAVLDPILIFGLDMGIEGAAWASVVARLTVAAIALGSVVHLHKFITRPSLGRLRQNVMLISAIALPAVLTNIATPFGNAYVTWSLAPYGDSVLAGWAVIGRIIPVAFGVIFALSGAIGPIYGQNFGAKRYDRLLQAYKDGLIFTTVFVLCVAVILNLAQDQLVAAFSLSDAGAELVRIFCVWLAPTFAFTGVIFVANAAFNNLGRAKLATLFNWGRASLGTVPFVIAGAYLGGAQGIIIGNFLGAVAFGIGAVWTAFVVIKRCQNEPPDAPPPGEVLNPQRPLWPFSSRRI